MLARSTLSATRHELNRRGEPECSMNHQRTEPFEGSIAMGEHGATSDVHDEEIIE